MALAGFSASEAEGLRRAMSRKRSEAALRAYRERFLEGAAERGVDAALAERVFEQILGFSGFGFPKAHAVAFGLLAYQSTWLRVHYGPEFLCSLLNEQPMGFYPARRAGSRGAAARGSRCCGPDVNAASAGWTCAVEDGRSPCESGSGTSRGCARRMPRPWSPSASAAATYLRGRGARLALGDRARRARAPGVGERLRLARRRESLASAFSRREALWELGAASGGRRLPAGTQLALPLEAPAAPDLRSETPWERLVADYASTGMTLGEHPM